MILILLLNVVISICLFNTTFKLLSEQFLENINHDPQTTQIFQPEIIDRLEKDKKSRVVADNGFIIQKFIPLYMQKKNSTLYTPCIKGLIPKKLNPSTLKFINQFGDQTEEIEVREYVKGSREQTPLNSIRAKDSARSVQSNLSVLNECQVCCENLPNCIFLTCGHAGTCYECSLDLWEKNDECYLCRNLIIQLLQIDCKTKYEKNYFKVISATQMIQESKNI